MVDDRTPSLLLPLPQQTNTLLEDVARLRTALGGIDASLSAKQPTLGYVPENSASKGAANGYAGLDSMGKVPAGQLPSFVDDVLEYANVAAFPTAGESSKIYTALNVGADSKIYRWSGSVYIEISASPGSTDSVSEGSLNLYFTDLRARNAQAKASTAGLGLVRVGANLTVDPLTGIVSAGSAASKNAPAMGDAAIGEVVLGSDTRLLDATARTKLNGAASAKDQVVTCAINATAAFDLVHNITAAGVVLATPASPAIGQKFKTRNSSGVATPVLNAGADLVYGLPWISLDLLGVTLEWEFYGGSVGWSL